jgi:hypothetical protein
MSYSVRIEGASATEELFARSGTVRWTGRASADPDAPLVLVELTATSPEANRTLADVSAGAPEVIDTLVGSAPLPPGFVDELARLACRRRPAAVLAVLAGRQNSDPRWFHALLRAALEAALLSRAAIPQGTVAQGGRIEDGMLVFHA